MFIAALVMAYTTPLCMDTSEATLELNSTHPSRDFTSRGWNSWHSAKEDSRLTSISARYSSGVKSTVGLRVLNPTLETRMSTLPRKRSEARAHRSARLAREDTSHADPVTSSPRARHSATHASTSASVRAHVWTLAPWLASASTIARLRFIGRIEGERVSDDRTAVVILFRIVPRRGADLGARGVCAVRGRRTRVLWCRR